MLRVSAAIGVCAIVLFGSAISAIAMGGGSGGAPAASSSAGAHSGGQGVTPAASRGEPAQSVSPTAPPPNGTCQPGKCPPRPPHN
jgi:hypothetical protein